jgi:hypothetical protein
MAPQLLISAPRIIGEGRLTILHATFQTSILEPKHALGFPSVDPDGVLGKVGFDLGAWEAGRNVREGRGDGVEGGGDF